MVSGSEKILLLYHLPKTEPVKWLNFMNLPKFKFSGSLLHTHHSDEGLAPMDRHFLVEWFRIILKQADINS